VDGSIGLPGKIFLIEKQAGAALLVRYTNYTKQHI
jgi:hypothetical protein